MDFVTRGLRGSVVFATLAAVSASAAAIEVSAAEPVSADPTVAAAAIVATNSIHLKTGANITGDVVATTASPGPTLISGFEIFVDKPATITGNMKGDSISLSKNISISGFVRYNQLSNTGASIGGGTFTPLALPAATLPPFQEATLRAGAPDVLVDSGQTVVLAAGDYDEIQVAPTGVLQFAGGIYNVRSIQPASPGAICSFPCRSFLFAGSTSLRVAERVDVGRSARVQPNAGVTPSQVVLYVGGANGGTGAPTATPPAVWVGRESVAKVNVYAPRGTIQIDRDSTLQGALLGADVRLDSNTSLTRANAFANVPPVANPAIAYTHGLGTIPILLTGSDPENEDLSFSLVTTVPATPAHGSVSIVQSPPPTFPGNPPGCGPETPGCIPADPPRTSALALYTPNTDENLEDSFVFAVTDPHAASGTATVHINPPDDTTPEEPPLTTVRAADGMAETAVDVPIQIHLQADAPGTVDVTFSIFSDPSHGDLSNLVQGAETPRRSATVLYSPDSGFGGVDSFVFEACGTLVSGESCDQGTITITVQGELADDVHVDTFQETEVAVTLSGTPGAGTQTLIWRIVGKAAFLDGAEMAGNVADADDNGFGDNHNALPGSTPRLMSAGVGQSGGPGSNGTVRMQMEWDISSLGGLSSSLQSAEVVLTTNRGTVDDVDTFFFVGTGNNDGLLTDGDFEAPATQLAGVTMPVTGDEGVDGTFSFSVLQQLRQALASDRQFFTVQGRVDETGTGAARGLQVYTTADANLLDHSEPQLALATPGVTPPPLTFSIQTLPAHGTLRTSGGALIADAPFTLADAIVRYTPTGGDDQFTFQAEDFLGHTAIATVFVRVLPGFDPCTQNGREPGCLP